MSPARPIAARALLALSAFVAVMAFAGAPRPLAAHEIGVVEVAAVVAADGTYRVDVPIDPLSTLQRLQVEAGEPLSAEPTEAEARAGIAALADTVREHVVLRFDGVAAAPDLAYVPQPPLPSGPLGLLRLTGRVPEGAETFDLSYDLVFTRYALRLSTPGADEATVVWLEPGETSEPFSLHGGNTVSHLAVARQYLVLGFTHILPKGLDHILFVLGIFLLSTRWKPLLAQVTAFTVAHSITLGLSMYGIVSLPSSVVEPLIALSIVYVAVENLLTRELHSWRVAVVFGFGLLHGLGFAGVLRDLGLPRAGFATALVTFNVGVELGQLAVIGLAFLLVASWARRRAWYRRRVVVPASLAIAAVGLFWTVQRVWPG